MIQEKAERKVCGAHIISMNTTLPPTHINQKERKETTHVSDNTYH